MINIIEELQELIEVEEVREELESLKEKEELTEEDIERLKEIAQDTLEEENWYKYQDIVTRIDRIVAEESKTTESSKDPQEESEEEIEPEEEIEETLDEEREIEKIRTRIFENYNASIELTKEFVKENTDIVRDKLINIVSNSEIDDERKQSLLNRLNNNSNADVVISVLQDTKIVADNQFIISIIEEELGKEIQEELIIDEENKEDIVEIVKQKIIKDHDSTTDKATQEELITQLNKLTETATIEEITQIINKNNYNKDNELAREVINVQLERVNKEIEEIENVPETELEEQNKQEINNLEEELAILDEKLEEQQNKLASINLNVTEENKDEIIELAKKELEKEIEKISIAMNGELGEKRQDLKKQLEILNNKENLSDEDLLKIINSNNLNDNIQITLLENQKNNINYSQNDLKEQLKIVIDKEIELRKADSQVTDREKGEKIQQLIKLRAELNKENLSDEEFTKIMTEFYDNFNKEKKYNFSEEFKKRKTKEIDEKIDLIKNGKNNLNYEISATAKKKEELKAKIDKLKNSTKGTNKNLEELKAKKQQLEEKLANLGKSNKNDLQEKLDKFKSLDNKHLNEIKDAYYTLKEKVIKTLENDEEFLNLDPQNQTQKIDEELLKYKELIDNTLATYESSKKSDKLIQELVDEIRKELNKEKIHEEEKPKKDWKKYGAALLGFATGVGLSLVKVGTGTGLIIATVRLAYSAIKKSVKVSSIERKEGEDNRIIKIINKEGYKEQHPIKTAFLEKLEKVYNLLKKPETQWFINGFAVGYTVGKLSQFAYNKFKPEPPTPTPEPTPNPIPEPTPTPDPIIPAEAVKPGIDDTLDVRGIKGYVNSLGEGKTSIIKELAGKATIAKDKKTKHAILKNGYYLLKGSDGQDLGWFKASDIENKAKIVKDVAETVSKHVR